MPKDDEVVMESRYKIPVQDTVYAKREQPIRNRALTPIACQAQGRVSENDAASLLSIVERTCLMLHSYSAELNSNQLIWLDQPPQPLIRKRVLVVVEEVAGSESISSPSPSPRYDFTHLAGRLQWNGDAVAAQRESRDAQ